MKTKGIRVLVLLGFLASCGNPENIAPLDTGYSSNDVSDIYSPSAFEGRAGGFEFLLDEDVFEVERTQYHLLIAIALYLPFLLL